jgi:hypothetical protein
MTSIISIAFILYLFLGLIWMLSLKARIQRQHARELSNRDINDLAKAGDELAIRLARRSKVFLGAGVVFAVLIATIR